MKATIAACLVVGFACKGGKAQDDKAANTPAPKLIGSNDKQEVPSGYPTSFMVQGGGHMEVPYSQIAFIGFMSKPAIEFRAEGGGFGRGVSMDIPIPEAIDSVSKLAGQTIEVDHWSLSNLPDMAIGKRLSVRIDEVTATYLAGSFEGEICASGEPDCALPRKVTNGKFRAFRSPSADDQAFAQYTGHGSAPTP